MTASIERANFTFPTEPSRQLWCAWLRHHTIDPHDVALPGFVEVDYRTYRISYLSYVRDDEGQIQLDGDEPACAVKVVQLEARPSPFPGSDEAAPDVR